MSPEASSAQSNREIFLAALQIENPQQRQAFLERACGGDLRRLHELERLLASNDAGADSPLDRALANVAATDPLTSPVLDISQHPMIGPYKLLEQIGEGGMGVVYVAQQQQPLRRTVALKIIKPGMDSRQVVARFTAERQALALMNHPHIAKVLDAGTTESGSPYFVMELVKGIPITDFCDQHKLDLRQRLALFAQVCEAVQHAHQKGVIHRDLKPNNILVELADVKAVPKVIDFGVAKAIHQSLTEHTLYTAFEQMIGTPLYMSPEQAQLNSLDVDTRSDIYSLGVLLYELLTGSTPFDRETLKRAGIDEMRRMIREVDPPRPSVRISTLAAASLSTVSDKRHIDPRKLSQSVRAELDWIVLKALEKDRSRRFQTAAAFAADVQRYLDGVAVQACPPTRRYRFGKFARRHKSILATVFLVACSILVATTVSVLQALRAIQAEQVAEVGFQSEREARQAEQAARIDAEQAQALAQRYAADAYQQQYKAEVQLGLVDLQAGNLARLYQMLVKHLPDPQRADQRGWEWYYLLSRCLEGRRLCNHYDYVSSMDWSPDGRWLATTSKDTITIVWDAQSGQLVRRFSLGDTRKCGMAWSPDGRYLAWGSGSPDDVVLIWNRETDEIFVLRGHAFSLTSINWSPDGTRLVTTSYDYTARIWDVETRTCLHVLAVKGHGGNTQHLNAAFWIADGNSIVTAGHNGINVWDARSGELLQELFPDTRIHTASMSSTRPQIVLGTVTGQCQLIDMESWQATHLITAHAGQVNQVKFSPDGNSFATAGVDGTAKIWDAQQGRELFVMRGTHIEVSSLAWEPNGKQLAAGCSDGTVKLWELPPPHQPATISALADAIYSIQWTRQDQLLTSVDVLSGTRTVWDRSTKQNVETTVIEAGIRVAFSPDSQLKATVIARENDGGFKLTVEKVADNQVIGEYQYSPNKLTYDPLLVWSPDSKRLIAHQYDHLEVWSVADGRQIFNLNERGLLAVAWSPDCSRLALGLGIAEGAVHVIDVEHAKRLLKVRFGQPGVLASAVAWNAGGDHFAAGNRQGQIGVWEATSGREISFARPHIAAIKALDWAPNGLRIASASEDGRLKICNPLSGDELLSLTDGQQPITAVKWSSDGMRLAAGDAKGSMQIWDAAAGNIHTSHADQRKTLAEMHASLASRYMDENLSLALAEITKAMELAPNHPSYSRRRAIIRARQGQLDEALLDLTAAFELDPDDTWVLGTRLNVYTSLERWNEALTDASRLVELKQTALCRYYQAVIQLKLGQTEAYRKICHQEVNRDADESNAEIDQIAWMCTLLPKAIDDYERILAVARLQAEPDPISLGALLYRAGHVAEAVDVLTDARRALEQESSLSLNSPFDSRPVYSAYLLAMACHELGRVEESQAWYDQAEARAQHALAQPVVFLKIGSVTWNQRIVLELLQSQTRQLLGITASM